MPLHVERRGRVAVLTLDDPERRNALSQEMVVALTEAVATLEADEAVGAIVVTGAPPAFCSGADVSALTSLGGEGQNPHDVRDIYAGFLRVLECRLPTLAAVNGPAVGAGFNLALACDVRIAGESARFDARFLRIGIHPGGGHTWLLDRAVGPQAAAAMNLFGERVDGRRAAEIGLAWECVPDAGLLDRATELAARAADAPRELATRVKATLRHAPWQPNFDDALRFELEHQVWSFRQPEFTERMQAPRDR
ncbi:MAG: enoyl-CoA hydratase [Acidimicrobiia bacterium]